MRWQAYDVLPARRTGCAPKDSSGVKEPMKWGRFLRITALGAAAVLAGCVVKEPTETPDIDWSKPETFEVVPLAQLPETPPRGLSGRFVRTSWQNLPQWQTDDLEEFWGTFLRNCRGL